MVLTNVSKYTFHIILCIYSLKISYMDTMYLIRSMPHFQLPQSTYPLHLPADILKTYRLKKKIYWTGLVLPICTRMKGYPLDHSPSTRGHALSLSWYTLIANIPSVMGEPLWALPSSILESGLTSSCAEKHSCHELMSANSHVSTRRQLCTAPPHPDSYIPSVPSSFMLPELWPVLSLH